MSARLCLLFLMSYLLSVSAQSDYVGSETCADCHSKVYEHWKGSHHDWAMKQPNENNVLGDFNDVSYSHRGKVNRFTKKNGKFFIETENKNGQREVYQVAYTFGKYPLQQYLIEFDGGQFQVPSIAWDSRPEIEGGQRWFSLYPNETIPADDPLHWTGPYFNWNSRCADCHSTNLKKKYDSKRNLYNTSWSEINVACEACHGPGNNHVTSARSGSGITKGLTWPVDSVGQWLRDDQSATASPSVGSIRNPSKQVEICAACHSRRARLRETDVAEADDFLDVFDLQLLTEPVYFSDGQIRDEDYVYGSFLQSKMYRAGVVCSNCHDPHSLSLKVVGNGLCAQCHNSKLFDSTSHHHHPKGAGSECVGCHMPETTYMVVDPRRDHSFSVPRPDKSNALNTPNACLRCHDEKSNDWASGVVDSWLKESGRSHKTRFYENLDELAGVVRPDIELIKIAMNSHWPDIVRGSMFARLSDSPTIESINAAVYQLNIGEPLVRRGALNAFVNVPLDAKREYLVPHLKDATRAVRVEVAKQLSGIDLKTLNKSELSAFSNATDELLEFLELQSDTPEGLLSYAEFHRSRGELPEAIEKLEEAFNIAPNLPQVVISLSDAYRVGGQVDRSESILLDFIKRQPESALGNYSVGLMYIRKSQYEIAERHFSLAVKAMPENLYWQVIYALALERNDKFDRASQILEEQINKYPHDQFSIQALIGLYEKRSGYRTRVLKLKEMLAP